VLHVLGKLPMNFDQEKVMGTFRTNLGVDGSAPKHDGVQVTCYATYKIKVLILFAEAINFRKLWSHFERRQALFVQ
jgi:hypothetical protein